VCRVVSSSTAPSSIGILVSLFCLILTACGGGGTSGVTPPPPPADFTIALVPSSISLVPGSSTSVQASMTPKNGFSGTVSLAAGTLPAGLTISPNLPQNVGAAGLILTISTASSAAAGKYSLQLTGTSGSLQHSATEALTVNPAPDFSLSIGNPTLTVQQQGAYRTQVVSATPLNGFSQTISLSVSGLPAGVTTVPSIIPPFNLSGAVQGSSFGIAASSSAAVGSSTVTVTAASGTTNHTGTFSLSVTPVAPFLIQTSPASLSMTPATSMKVQVSVTANSGTSPQLGVNVSPAFYLPNGGVSISSPQGTLTTTKPVSFNVQAEVSAQAVQNFPLVITASDSSNNSSVTVLPLSVTIPYSSRPSPTRSTFVRTDRGPTGVVYDPVRKLLFVSVEVLNQVAVLSSVDGHRVATIPVMYPEGIDESADGSAVYVVSPYSQFITMIDPNLLEVVQQSVLPQNQSGFNVATLSNGEVLVLMDQNGAGLPTVYLWNPAAKSFTAVGQSLLPVGSNMVRSADRSKVLFYEGSTSNTTAALYDVVSGSFTGPVTLNNPYNMAISPDGSQIVALASQSSPTVFYNGQFQMVGSLSLGLFPLTGIIYSQDGSHAYALGVDAFAGNVAVSIDTKTFSEVGMVPGFGWGTSALFSGRFLSEFATDETNMMFGPVPVGMSFLDMNSAGFVTLPLFGVNLIQPTLLSLSAPTQLQLSGGPFSSGSAFTVNFGAAPAAPQTQLGTNLSVQSESQISLTSPAGTAAGPANATVTRSDGFFQLLPDAITYGPTILKLDANAGSAAGGDSITVFGYGFESSNAQVTIGGKSATITQVTGPGITTTLPIQRIILTTPSGTPGNADVTVTATGGSATLPGGFQYLTSAQIFPMTGALDDIVYDRGRQRLYLSNTDHNRVEIFDIASQTYLSPVSVGNQPAGLALTPDGALLGVVNFGDGTVSVIDPNKMQVVNTWPALIPAESGTGNSVLTIAAATPHRTLVDVYNAGTLGGGSIHMLDLDTGSLSCSGSFWCTNGTDVSGFTLAAMAATPDGSEVFLADITQNSGSSIGLLNLTTNTLTRGFADAFHDAAANADGNIFVASFGIANDQLSRVSLMAYEPYTDSGNQSSDNLVGEKLNPSGSLLYVPQSSSVGDVDIFDVHTGRLVLNVVLPEPLPSTLNAMALDETGTKMFLISNSGVTIVQLSQLPLSLASINPAAGAQATQVTLRGSGFQNGATVTFGSSQVPATYIDQNTLTAILPALSTGPIRVTVTNPGAHAYSFDAAFSVQ
jgi:DNA-binding beta-propeller fold protein YncE